mgnify:CR=1 FL=1
MKYFITLILLITVLTYMELMETEFPLVLNIALVILIFLTVFFWEYSVFKNNIKADFKIRSQRKTISILEIGMAIAWTSIVLFLSGNRITFSYLIFVFWSIPFSEFIMWFIYKKKKPYNIFIKGNELILNRRWNLKRNLTKLTQIRYDRFSKNLKLDFKSKFEISIKSSEYNTDDIEKLLEILIEKSENNISIPNNYKPKIKNSC